MFFNNKISCYFSILYLLKGGEESPKTVILHDKPMINVYLTMHKVYRDPHHIYVYFIYESNLCLANLLII